MRGLGGRSYTTTTPKQTYYHFHYTRSLISWCYLFFGMEGSIMGQVRHKYVTAAHAITAAIQQSQAITAALSREPIITVKTVAKWRKCETVEDRKTRPTHPSSTVLKADEEAMIVAFRRHTRLPTDDCLYALQPTIPHLTRSSLYRC